MPKSKYEKSLRLSRKNLLLPQMNRRCLVKTGALVCRVSRNFTFYSSDKHSWGFIHLGLHKQHAKFQMKILMLRVLCIALILNEKWWKLRKNANFNLRRTLSVSPKTLLYFFHLIDIHLSNNNSLWVNQSETMRYVIFNRDLHNKTKCLNLT